MKRTRKDLEHQIETLNKLLGGEAYFLEVLSREVYGPYRFSLGNKNGSGRPLCTWDRMPMSEMYQYLRAAIAAIGAYKAVNNLNN
jgi:hypothetical protein